MIKEANLLLKAHLDQLPMWAESMRELQRKNKIKKKNNNKTK